MSIMGKASLYKIHRESLFLFLDNSGGEAASLQENFNKKISSFNTP